MKWRLLKWKREVGVLPETFDILGTTSAPTATPRLQPPPADRGPVVIVRTNQEFASPEPGYQQIN